MGDVRELFPDTGALGLTAWYGIIAANATELSDLLPVIIPEFDQHLQWGPCRWQSRDMTTDNLPHKGDPCLVVMDNRRNPWIVAWWPF
jgi:hypothetical protein